jgi:hypothetical protein
MHRWVAGLYPSPAERHWYISSHFEEGFALSLHDLGL